MPTRKKQGSTYVLLLGASLAAFGPLEILSSTAFAAENPVPLINQPLVPDATAPAGRDSRWRCMARALPLARW
jgi:hypothetical protein